MQGLVRLGADMCISGKQSCPMIAEYNFYNDPASVETAPFRIGDIKKEKGLAGEHLGAPPYGYLRNPDDKTRWLVDEEAAALSRQTTPHNRSLRLTKCHSP